MNPLTKAEDFPTSPSLGEKQRRGGRAEAVEVFRREVEATTDPNAADDQGEPWLHRAAFRGDTHAVDILLERGADPNRANGRGATALHMAVMRGRAEVASAMLDRGADPLVRDAAGWSSLDRAVVRNDRELAELLVDRGAEVRTADKRGVTPLHRTRSRSVAKLLLDHGADPNARDESGRRPVEREPVTRVLFERCLEDLKRAEPGCGGRADRTRGLRGIQNLVDLGLAPTRSGKRGDTLLHRAARQGDVRWLALLLAHGANPNAWNNASDVPLHGARNSSIVRLLLEHGADTEARNACGETPLHQVHSSDSVGVLLEYGADPNARTDDGEVRLHQVWSADTARLLLENGADPNAQADDGKAPLHTRSSSADMVRILLEYGADPNARTDDGGVPLHQTPSSTEAARVLLEHGADPNAQNTKGRTPLHRCQRRNLVRLLLAHGADPSIPDKAGHTALHAHLRASIKRPLLTVPPGMAMLLMNHVVDPSAPEPNERTLHALDSGYADIGAPGELRDDISLDGLEERLLRGDIPEGAARVVVTVRLAEETVCWPGVRKWLKAHVPNANPYDEDFGLPVAEVMRLASRSGDSAEAAGACAYAIRMACAIVGARRAVASRLGRQQSSESTPAAP